jgi:hypothetical protein
MGRRKPGIQPFMAFIGLYRKLPETHDLKVAKVEVVSSNLIARSIFSMTYGI